MILYQSECKGKKIEIGVSYMPYRTKPCLVVCDGNAVTKYASFNNEYAAREFMDMFADFVGMPRIDWNGDDVPWGLLKAGESND